MLKFDIELKAIIVENVMQNILMTRIQISIQYWLEQSFK